MHVSQHLWGYRLESECLGTCIISKVSCILLTNEKTTMTFRGLYGIENVCTSVTLSPVFFFFNLYYAYVYILEKHSKWDLPVDSFPVGSN